MARKPSYGIDAPNVIRNQFIAGAVFLVIALAFPRVTIAHVEFLLFPGFLWPAGWFFVFGTLMLIYSLKGKFRHRDRMLAKVQWTGTEAVLDVGTGRGLLLIGAAKRARHRTRHGHRHLERRRPLRQWTRSIESEYRA